MRTRDFGIFLGFEIFSIVWAGLLFTRLESRVLAGALAGSFFLLSGLVMLWWMHRWEAKWRAPTWYVALFQVYAISFPLMVSRFFQIGMEFENVRILGFTGPVFHQISNFVFIVLVLSTIFDGVRAIKTKRAASAAL